MDWIGLDLENWTHIQLWAASLINMLLLNLMPKILWQFQQHSVSALSAVYLIIPPSLYGSEIWFLHSSDNPKPNVVWSNAFSKKHLIAAGEKVCHVCCITVELCLCHIRLICVQLCL